MVFLVSLIYEVCTQVIKRFIDSKATIVIISSCLLQAPKIIPRAYLAESWFQNYEWWKIHIHPHTIGANWHPSWQAQWRWRMNCSPNPSKLGFNLKHIGQGVYTAIAWAVPVLWIEKGLHSLGQLVWHLSQAPKFSYKQKPSDEEILSICCVA